MLDLRKNGHIYRGKGHVLQFLCLISSDASVTVTYHLQSDLSVTFLTQPYSKILYVANTSNQLITVLSINNKTQHASIYIYGFMDRKYDKKICSDKCYDFERISR